MRGLITINMFSACKSPCDAPFIAFLSVCVSRAVTWSQRLRETIAWTTQSWLGRLLASSRCQRASCCANGPTSPDSTKSRSEHDSSSVSVSGALRITNVALLCPAIRKNLFRGQITWSPLWAARKGKTAGNRGKNICEHILHFIMSLWNTSMKQWKKEVMPGVHWRSNVVWCQ